MFISNSFNDSTFAGITAGAALFSDSLAKLTIEGNIFSNLSSSSFGGAIALAKPFRYWSLFYGNVFVGCSSPLGGAVYVDSGPLEPPENGVNLFSNNQAFIGPAFFFASSLSANDSAVIAQLASFANNRIGLSAADTVREQNYGTCKLLPHLISPLILSLFCSGPVSIRMLSLLPSRVFPGQPLTISFQLLDLFNETVPNFFQFKFQLSLLSYQIRDGVPVTQVLILFLYNLSFSHSFLLCFAVHSVLQWSRSRKLFYY
jgi:hypothetical protein